MQKISSSTTTANAAGEFTEGSSSAGVDSTLIKAAWLNTIQRELVAIVEAAGLSLKSDNDTQVLTGINAILAKAIAGFLSRSGGQMTGPLQAKIGAPNAGNTNAAGFVFDIDTGLFSPSDGLIQLAADGAIILQGMSTSALQSMRAIRVPKGAPASVDQSYLTGYTFADDGDTGMFAEGGTSANAGSDIVFRIDGGEVGRLKLVMKSSTANGWGRMMNGQIMQWAEINVTPTSGSVKQWTVTLPTTFPTAGLQMFAVLGSGNGSTKVLVTAESITKNQVSGFIYAEDTSSRVIRIFAIGE